MIKRIKHEIKFIGENIPVILLGTFVCCIGGILLWVSGGSGWYCVYALSHGHIPSLAALFLVWFAVYGLCGAVMALSCLWDRTSLAQSFHELSGMKAACLGGAGYLMMLSWYAVFFCTRLIFFSAALLVLSFLCYGAILFILRKRFLLLTLALILIEIIQLCFICFNFSFCLLK